MICFQICTFEPLETTKAPNTSQHIQLWFAFKFVPLNHWKQHWCRFCVVSESCDLLSNLYLWTIGNNFENIVLRTMRVVICFQICTFEPLETTAKFFQPFYRMLWFAFKFVPLNHWKQPVFRRTSFVPSCDLLSNLYLWTIGNNYPLLRLSTGSLWFAFKFVPLNHWKQQNINNYLFINYLCGNSERRKNLFPIINPALKAGFIILKEF